MRATKEGRPLAGMAEDYLAKAMNEADASAFGFDEHCRFQMNGESGYGVVK